MTADALPFLVVVDAKRHAMLWGSYPTQDSAEQSARRLRLLGLNARVVASDETTPANGIDRPREAP